MDTKAQKVGVPEGQNANMYNLKRTFIDNQLKQNQVASNRNLLHEKQEPIQEVNQNKQFRRTQKDCRNNTRREIQMQIGKVKEMITHIYYLQKSLERKEVSILFREGQLTRDIKEQTVNYLKKVILEIKPLYYLYTKLQSYSNSVILNKQKFVNLQSKLQQFKSENIQLKKRQYRYKKCLDKSIQTDSQIQLCQLPSQETQITQAEVKHTPEQSSEQNNMCKDNFIVLIDEIPQIITKLLIQLQKIQKVMNQQSQRRQTSKTKFMKNLILSLKQAQNNLIPKVIKQTIQQMYQNFVNYNKRQSKQHNILNFEKLQTVLCFQKLKELSKLSVKSTSEKSILTDGNNSDQINKNISKSKSFHLQDRAKKTQFQDCFWQK